MIRKGVGMRSLSIELLLRHLAFLLLIALLTLLCWPSHFTVEGWLVCSVCGVILGVRICIQETQREYSLVENIISKCSEVLKF